MKPEIPTEHYSCAVLADSLHPRARKDRMGPRARLTTVVVKYPRPYTAQLNTHRMLSRNGASSRAIPTAKLTLAVLLDPYVPEAFGSRRPGMRGGDLLSPEDQEAGREEWLAASRDAVRRALAMEKRGIHKEHVNRLLEPFMWTTTIISATDWSNFFHRRLADDAQPEMQRLAQAIHAALEASEPVVLEDVSRWQHLPLILEEERADPKLEPVLHKISAARCARVSYLTHAGVRDIGEDLALHDRLLEQGHLSPFEHPARPGYALRRYGNFLGFCQYRKTIPMESDRPAPAP